MSKRLKSRIVSMPLRELAAMPHRCAWKGCTEHASFLGTPPRDWRWLAVWWGPVAVPPWADGNVEDRDALLCPRHSAELDGLLEDIGNRLKTTKGNA